MKQLSKYQLKKVSDNLDHYFNKASEKDIEEGKKWAGVPATPFINNQRSQVVYQRLPELERRLAELESELKNLKK